MSVQPWYFTVTVDNRRTDNGLIRVESGKKHTTMAIRLVFLIDNLFVKLSSQVFHRDSLIFLLAFLHTELGLPVVQLGITCEIRSRHNLVSRKDPGSRWSRVTRRQTFFHWGSVPLYFDTATGPKRILLTKHFLNK